MTAKSVSATATANRNDGVNNRISGKNRRILKAKQAIDLNHLSGASCSRNATCQLTLHHDHEELEANEPLGSEMSRKLNLGDREAICLLHRQFNPVLRGYLRKHLSSESDISDVAQDTWLRVLRKSHRNFRPNERFVVWLLFQGRSELSAFLRRRRKRYCMIPIDDVSEPSTRSDGLNTECDSVDDVARAKDALKQLNERHRAVLYLRFLCGYSQAECAEELGVNIGTIGSRQTIGLRRLRSMLEREAIR